MKEIPILFSTEMVRAILDGRKSMTRRVVKPQPELFYTLGETRDLINPEQIAFKVMEKGGKDVIVIPPWQPGDKLWVRETTWISECKRYLAHGFERGHSSEYDIVDLETGKRYTHQRDRGDYALTDGMVMSWSWRGRHLRNGRQTEEFDVSFADVDTAIKIVPFSGNIILKNYEAQFRKKLPSIFMPKAAARIWLEVVSVRVERLQDITEEDAVKEGVKAYGPNNCSGTSARIAFAELWDSLNEKRGYGWDTSPWVWVVEFRRVER